MKIYSGKREDILRRKAEYESKKKAYDEYREKRSREFRLAEEDVLDPVARYIERRLSQFDLLQFDVSATRNWSSKRDGDTIQVRIYCDRDRSMSDKTSPLSWEYSASVSDEGEILKESSSYSGLKATTSENIESLRQTVDALETLNDIDWPDLLIRKLPNFLDYRDGEDAPEMPEKEDFNAQLIEAEIEEVIGKPIGLYGGAAENTGYRVGSSGYYLFFGETPKQYKATFISQYMVDNVGKEGFPATVSELINNHMNDVPVSFRKTTIHNALHMPIEKLEG